MNAPIGTTVRARGTAEDVIEKRPIVRRSVAATVLVEVGTGAIAPKVAIVRRKAPAPVNVEVGTGAIAPKVAIARRKTPAAR